MWWLFAESVSGCNASCGVRREGRSRMAIRLMVLVSSAVMLGGCQKPTDLVEQRWLIDTQSMQDDRIPNVGEEVAARRRDPRLSLLPRGQTRQHLIIDAEEWRRIWQLVGRDPPSVDFLAHMVVGVLREIQTAYVRGVVISKVEATGDSLLVHVWERTPGPDEVGPDIDRGVQVYYAMIPRSELPLRFVIGQYWDTQQVSGLEQALERTERLMGRRD